ncbi:unnamed protein product [Tuber aestivum]|uniref:Uncharacterized protein n=1 Tax=Tuber aestivum TaxID=59557 RepID=A0A292Q7X6_9PEZI|nr:unnamed protein product [Tuber aestivum]
MTKRKKNEVEVKRVVDDEILGSEYLIGDFSCTSDNTTPVPTLDNKRWEKLMDEERIPNIGTARETIPQALQELMSERLAIDIYFGKLHYFWAYMFFYHWDFSREERDLMFKNTKPIGYLVPRWIQRPESLIGFFDQTYDKFTGWICDRVVLYGEMYLSSDAGKLWESRFNSASEMCLDKPEPDIMSGILFGILEMQDVFTPLLRICELTKSRLGYGYWISETKDGGWWAARLKQKFIQAVIYYVIEETEKHGSQTQKPMREILRKCSPLPPPREHRRPPVKNPGEINWGKIARPFSQPNDLDAVGLLGEDEPVSSQEEEDWQSSFPRSTPTEIALEDLGAADFNETISGPMSDPTQKMDDSDPQSPGTLTAPLPQVDPPKVTNLPVLRPYKDPERSRREGRRLQGLQGRATKSLFDPTNRGNPEEVFDQTQKEETENPSSIPDRIVWVCENFSETLSSQASDSGRTQKVADKLSEEESHVTQESTVTLPKNERHGTKEIADYLPEDERQNTESDTEIDSEEEGDWWVSVSDTWTSKDGERFCADCYNWISKLDYKSILEFSRGRCVHALAAEADAKTQAVEKRQREQSMQRVQDEERLKKRKRMHHSPTEGVGEVGELKALPTSSGGEMFKQQKKSVGWRRDFSDIGSAGRVQVGATSGSTEGNKRRAKPTLSRAVALGQEPIGGTKFIHARRLGRRTKSNQPLFFNPDIIPATAADATQKNLRKGGK